LFTYNFRFFFVPGFFKKPTLVLAISGGNLASSGFLNISLREKKGLEMNLKKNFSFRSASGFGKVQIRFTPGQTPGRPYGPNGKKNTKNKKWRNRA